MSRNCPEMPGHITSTESYSAYLLGPSKRFAYSRANCHQSVSGGKTLTVSPLFIASHTISRVNGSSMEIGEAEGAAASTIASDRAGRCSFDHGDLWDSFSQTANLCALRNVLHDCLTCLLCGGPMNPSCSSCSSRRQLKVRSIRNDRWAVESRPALPQLEQAIGLLPPRSWGTWQLECSPPDAIHRKPAPRRGSSSSSSSSSSRRIHRTTWSKTAKQKLMQNKSSGCSRWSGGWASSGCSRSCGSSSSSSSGSSGSSSSSN